MWYIRKYSVKNICFHIWPLCLSACLNFSWGAIEKSRFRNFSQYFCRPKQLKSRLVSWSMTDSGVINSGHEPNSVQSLLQCPFERRTLAEKLKVKELGPDQPDGFIYCEELFVNNTCRTASRTQTGTCLKRRPPIITIQTCRSTLKLWLL